MTKKWKDQIVDDPLLKLFDMEQEPINITEPCIKNTKAFIEILQTSLKNKIGQMEEKKQVTKLD